MLKSILNRFEEVIGALCLGAMGLISFTNVITRYLFHYSMAFTEEITLYLFVWVVLLGTSIAFREGANVTVSFLYDKLGKKAQKFLDLVSSAISLIFFVVLIYYSSIEVMDEIQVHAMTEAIELPMWWFSGAMPLVSVCIIVRIIVHTVQEFRPSASPKKE